MAAQEILVHAVAQQVLRGLRESLTIAGQVGQPVEAVNAALHPLQAECDDCLVLSQPYADEPWVVVTVVAWDAHKRAVGTMAPRSQQCLGREVSPWRVPVVVS